MNIMIEIDGPKTGWYEDEDGTKYIYISYGLGTKGNNAGELVKALGRWIARQDDANRVIVWRRRPTIESEEINHLWETGGVSNMETETYWKLTFRCVLLNPDGTQAVDSELIPEKPEGFPVERR